MARLAQATLDTIYLTARSGDEAVCLNRREGLHPIKTLTLNVGERRPLGVSAGGWRFWPSFPIARSSASSCSQAETRTQLPFDQITLRKMIATTREAGFAYYDAPVLHGPEIRHRHGRRSGADPAARQAADRLAQRRCNHGPASAAAPEGDRRSVAD